MRVSVIFNSVALLVTLTSGARAQRAGSANNAGPSGGGGSSSSQQSPAYQRTEKQLRDLESQLPACERRCAEGMTTCIASRARRGNESQVAAECRREADACTGGCRSASGGGATMPSFDPSTGNDSAETTQRPDYDAVAEMNDASEAQEQQLSQAWQQADAQRVAQAEQVAKQAIDETLGPLCANGTLKQNACAAIQQILQLPPLQVAAASYDRFRVSWGQRPGAKVPPLPPLSAAPRNSKNVLWPIGGASSSSQPPPQQKSPPDKGCYVTTDWIGVGNNFANPDPAPYISTAFTGNSYILHNAGSHDAYVGYPVPYDMLLPAGGDLEVSKGEYIDRTRPQPFQLEVGVKYWTDDESLCKDHAVHAGFTTPEEWGPDPPREPLPSSPDDLL